MKLIEAIKKFFAATPAPVDDPSHRWHLMLGQKLLGELVYRGYETPWVTADFFPTDEFSRYIPYFEWIKSIDDDADSDEPDTKLKALISEVNLLGRFRFFELKTKESWEPTVHFGGDYSSATFR